MLHGIDVSAENGRWNWEPWKPDANTENGLSFAFARANSWTGPSLDDDDEFQTNWRNMLHMGIVRGAYSEPRPGLSDPTTQATAFMRAVQRRGGMKDGDLIACAIDPVYAYVEPASFSCAWYEEYCHELNNLFPKHRVLIYCDLSIAESGITEGLDKWHLWLAQYGVAAPTVPERWAKYGITFWQSEGATPPDRDVYAGTRDELDTFCLAHVC